jgi:hypothetical protein
MAAVDRGIRFQGRRIEKRCKSCYTLFIDVVLAKAVMALKIGFVLLTHDKPEQALRLVSRLDSMFGAPPIAWHHDFSRNDLPLGALTKNISLVRPHVPTAWGKFSLIDVMVKALELLFGSNDAPDWFVLLSGACYPIKSADKIVKDLSESPYDAHIAHEPIRYNNYARPWQRTCYERYCSAQLRRTSLNRRAGATSHDIRVSDPAVAGPFLPFSETLSCFAGEQWFCANRQAAEYLLEFHRTKPALADHYRRLDHHVIVPDESYYQTILCNAPHLKISSNHWRYIDWETHGGQGVKILLMEDLPKLRGSVAHFARKFDINHDTAVLDALDADILPGRAAA